MFATKRSRDMVEKGKEKVTWMKVTAKLDSDKNVIKVKKALCSISQIRDQVFDEKSKTVTIKVVCCSPEQVMNKICRKGKGAITRIETIDPPKPEAQKPKEPEKPKEAEKPKEPEKPKPAPAGPSSQPMTITQAYNPSTMPMYNGYYCEQPYGGMRPTMGHPTMYNGPYSEWTQQPNGYYQRSVFDPYGGNHPQHESDCSIM